MLREHQQSNIFCGCQVAVVDLRSAEDRTSEVCIVGLLPAHVLDIGRT